MNPQDLFGKDYQSFGEIDPFNPRNTVEGYISRKSNEYYGALIITKVNNEVVTPELIMGTPKMHYPFVTLADGTRRYTFPSAKKIEIFEKLDGTNILAYYYLDSRGQRYLTFKTRLRPFATAGRFGDFPEMWKSVASGHFSIIKQIMHDYNCNLSFELYGSKNQHLIVYPNLLDFALLFGVSSSGRILSPTSLGLIGTISYKPIISLPLVRRLEVVDKDYVWSYEELQRKLQKELVPLDEGLYSGSEGTVWYLHTHDGKCQQVKCKPEAIEAIHFSAGASGISKNVILATCWNAFENMDTPTIEFIKVLLIEEFKPEKVEESLSLIEKCLEFVLAEMDFRQLVLEEYRVTGMNLHLQRSEVMRALSVKFDRGRMQKVYGIILSYA